MYVLEIISRRSSCLLTHGQFSSILLFVRFRLLPVLCFPFPPYYSIIPQIAELRHPNQDSDGGWFEVKGSL